MLLKPRKPRIQLKHIAERQRNILLVKTQLVDSVLHELDSIARKRLDTLDNNLNESIDRLGNITTSLDIVQKDVEESNLSLSQTSQDLQTSLDKHEESIYLLNKTRGRLLRDKYRFESLDIDINFYLKREGAYAEYLKRLQGDLQTSGDIGIIDSVISYSNIMNPGPGAELMHETSDLMPREEIPTEALAYQCLSQFWPIFSVINYKGDTLGGISAYDAEISIYSEFPHDSILFRVEWGKVFQDGWYLGPVESAVDLLGDYLVIEFDDCIEESICDPYVLMSFDKRLNSKWLLQEARDRKIFMDAKFLHLPARDFH